MPRPSKKYKSLNIVKTKQDILKDTDEDSNLNIQNESNEDISENLQNDFIEDDDILTEEKNPDNETQQESYTEIKIYNNWSENKDNVKFSPGQIVVSIKGKCKYTYRIGSPGKDYNTYFARMSGERDSIIIKGECYKLAPNKSEWIDYLTKKTIIVNIQKNKK